MARALLSNNKRNSKKLYYWILFTGHLRWERCKLAFAAKSETPNRWFLCKNCLNNSSKLKIIVSTKTAWRDTCENVSGPPEKDDYWRIPTPKGCLTELKKLRRLIKVCSQECIRNQANSFASLDSFEIFPRSSISLTRLILIKAFWWLIHNYKQLLRMRCHWLQIKLYSNDVLRK